MRTDATLDAPVLSGADESSVAVDASRLLCSGERIFFPPIGAVLQEIELGLGSELMRGHTKTYAPHTRRQRCIGHCGSVPARATARDHSLRASAAARG